MPELRFVRRFAGVLDLAPFAVSVAAALILWIAAFGFAMGLPLAYLLVGWVCWVLTNYFVEIIEHRALGSAGWPTFSLDTIASARRQLGLVLLALGVVVLVIRWWLLARGEATAAAVVTSAAILGAPPIAALLAVTRSIPRALDPRGVARAVVMLGVDYALCSAFAFGAAVLGSLAFARRGFFELLGAAFAVLALAFVIGSVVYDRRLKLGVYAPRSPEARLDAELQRLVGARRAALNHAYGIASGGSIARGLAHIAAYVATESDPLAARLWMFQEVGRWENGGAALGLGVALAADLNAVGRAEEAAKVLVTCRYIEDRLGAARLAREKRRDGPSRR
jgi:hypothetical protein